jgi:glycosyltransferase involved in cell wall biosynthesis
MDIFVLPSLSEALSNSLMEAMGCACCPVASHTGGNPELVADGETGLLSAPGDDRAFAAALAGLARDPGRRQELAAAALRRAAAFGVDSMVASYAALFERLAGATP